MILNYSSSQSVVLKALLRNTKKKLSFNKYCADFNNLLLIWKCFFFGFVLLGIDLAFLDTISNNIVKKRMSGWQNQLHENP